MKLRMKKIISGFICMMLVMSIFTPLSAVAANKYGFNSPFPGKNPLNYVYWEYSPSNGHWGIDIAWGGIAGTPIQAVKGGTVVAATYHSSWGYYVKIDHGGGIQTLYAHMRSSPIVSVGKSISSGQALGYVGSTGNSSGPHLHFEVYLNGTRVNPRPYLEGVNAVTEGSLDFATDTTIQGWAWRSAVPNTSIDVHIYVKNSSGNTVFFKDVAANIYRADLVTAGKGNGRHGFSYKMDWNSLPAGKYTVEAYAIDGTGANPKVGSTTYTHVAREGSLDFVTADTIQGWVWSSAKPNTPIEAHIYIQNSSGNTIFSTAVTAGNYRDDLVAAGKGNGKHGFTYKFDWRNYPTGVYTVDVYTVDGSGNNPKVGSIAYTNNIRKEGYIDEVTNNSVHGWAWSTASPNVPIDVHIYIKNSAGNTVLFAGGPADIYRSDLVTAGKGNGYHGYFFNIDWSSLPTGRYTVEAYVVDGTKYHPLIDTRIYNKT